MWNPTVALGTATHEYIGYLLPMGPFFVVTHLLGVPLWVAQRLWIGSILFAAGAASSTSHASWVCAGPGPSAAAAAYMLSPYFLQYAARISVILLPWAGLPFMLAFTIVALRRGGWREPALFAMVVALVSGINASSIIYVAVAPILWLLYAVLVLRESTLASRPGRRPAHFRAHPRSVPVVDGGPRGRGGLRSQRPEVHRDRLVDVADLQRLRDPPGPGLLVLLRLRPPGRLDDRGRPLHPEDRPAGHVLRRARPGRSWPLRSSAGASAPSSSCSSSSASSSRSGRSRTPTPHGSAAPSRTSWSTPRPGLALRSTDRATPVVLLALACSWAVR